MKSEMVLKGMCVSGGSVKGIARVIKNEQDLAHVQFGEILVLPNSHPIYAAAVLKSAALICENGGMLSHICIVALEMGMPCVTQVRSAMDTIKTGQAIFVDATEGAVFLDD